MTGTPSSVPVEKVSQDEMLRQFKEQYATYIKENQELSAKIKQNEVQALKLQGAIETLEYYGANLKQCHILLTKKRKNNDRGFKGTPFY